MAETWWVLKHPSGALLRHTAEVSEGWAWAAKWRRQKKANAYDLPAQVPPDWIAGLKAKGYRVVKVKVEEVDT